MGRPSTNPVGETDGVIERLRSQDVGVRHNRSSGGGRGRSDHAHQANPATPAVAPFPPTTPPKAIAGSLDALAGEIVRMRRLTELRLTKLRGQDPDWPAFRDLEAHLDRQERAALEAGTPLPVPTLIARYGLTMCERRILAALLAPHVDPALLPMYRELRGGGWWDGVDLRLLLNLLTDDLAGQIEVRRALAPLGALRQRRLVLFHPARTSPSLLHWEAELSPRLVHHLIGDDLLGGAFANLCERLSDGVPLDQVVLPAPQRDHVRTLVGHGNSARDALGKYGYDPLIQSGCGIVLLFVGPAGTGKSLLARALGAEFGRPVLRVRTDLLAAAERPDQAVDALQLEAELEHALLVLEDCEQVLGERGPLTNALLDLFERIRTPVVLTTRSPNSLDSAVDRHVLYRVDFSQPDAAQREMLWELHLPPDTPLGEDIDLPTLASRYQFSGAMIRQSVLSALHLALQRDREAPLIDMATLTAAADTQLRASLDDYTITMPSRHTLDDLVLPTDVMRRVRDLLGACKNRLRLMTDWGFGQKLTTGLGIVALFDGPPGTGKTFCAEIIGAELGAPVARINLPTIVSKWVGETEQRIADIFKRARSTGAILLFDEADSLFGRRVAEAQSSTDRYANMEVNLLLQEVERYEGIVLLTTNLIGGLDPAVLRRIHFRISFPEQDAELRARIFRGLVPRRAPVGHDVDFAELGKMFDLPGGRIQNAVLRACYLALSEGADQVKMAHFVSAATEEAQAAGKVIWAGGGRRATASTAVELAT